MSGPSSAALPLEARQAAGTGSGNGCSPSRRLTIPKPKLTRTPRPLPVHPGGPLMPVDCLTVAEIGAGTVGRPRTCHLVRLDELGAGQPVAITMQGAPESGFLFPRIPLQERTVRLLTCFSGCRSGRTGGQAVSRRPYDSSMSTHGNGSCGNDNRRRRHPPGGALGLRVEEAARLTRLSRATAYRLVGSGEWPSFRCGRRRLVPADGLRSWVAAQTAAAMAPARRPVDVD